MKVDCADRAMEMYNSLELEGDVFVVIQLARVLENREGLLLFPFFSNEIFSLVLLVC